MFSVHKSGGNLKTAITGHFEFVFEENHVTIVTSSLSESSAFKMFSVHTKTQGRRFQIPPAQRGRCLHWRKRNYIETIKNNFECLPVSCMYIYIDLV